MVGTHLPSQCEEAGGGDVETAQRDHKFKASLDHLSQINSKQSHEEFGIGNRQSSTFSGVGTYLPEKVPRELFSVNPC